MSRKSGRNTTVLSIRMPLDMYDKIKQCAIKRSLNVNDWSKLILANAAKYPIMATEPIEPFIDTSTTTIVSNAPINQS